MLDLKRAIRMSGLTQREVAERLGITLTSLYQIMTGNPTYAKMKEIAEVLNVDVVDLFFDEGRLVKPDDNKTYVCPKCGAKLEIDIKEV